MLRRMSDAAREFAKADEAETVEPADEAPALGQDMRDAQDGASPAWPRAILHLDMDAFFVNVHRLAHPEHRGIPLVVGGRPDGRGVVAAASYEARAFGIHSAMPMARAVRLCPDLTIVGHDWEAIQHSSRRVIAVLETAGPCEPMSVDEAYVDLSAEARPEARAAELQAEVRAATRLPCSVGLATSKLVAKVASDFEKPEGRTIVAPGTEAEFLAPLPVRALHGIGPATEGRLEALGIRSCGELAAADPARLARSFGRQAESLARRAAGVDARPVSTERGPRRSVSSERTFARDIALRAELEEVVARLAGEVAHALAKRDLVATTVVVKFREADFSTYTRQRPLAVPGDGRREITAAALALFRAHWPEGRPMRLLGVGVSGLAEKEATQLRLGL